MIPGLVQSYMRKTQKWVRHDTSARRLSSALCARVAPTWATTAHAFTMIHNFSLVDRARPRIPAFIDLTVDAVVYTISVDLPTLSAGLGSLDGRGLWVIVLGFQLGARAGATINDTVQVGDLNSTEEHDYKFAFVTGMSARQVASQGI